MHIYNKTVCGITRLKKKRITRGDRLDVIERVICRTYNIEKNVTHQTSVVFCAAVESVDTECALQAGSSAIWDNTYIYTRLHPTQPILRHFFGGGVHPSKNGGQRYLILTRLTFGGFADWPGHVQY